ncbi:hypothetical protein [Mycoplana dimorpha]|uniref:Uncharacterized protein n=1 Tax=Mycoplana dimorpha TaxID=28320 RepID=A0A2T5AXG2_MYCDI|nr:hypothetical protein [Mycoplana dimorpha]PTM91408.1 hypothetical protein C7449_10912 [Mycoplana dimorpha]
MSARSMFFVLTFMVASVLGILVVQHVAGAGTDRQPRPGELLSTPSQMAADL